MKIRWLAFIFAIATSTGAAAQDDPIHSDTPLWPYDAENVWPKSITDDSSIGCAFPIKLGDWAYEEEEELISWYGLTSYGVFHCFLIVQNAYERSSLDSVEAKRSFLIDLGKIESERGEMKLWALQIGARPGSDYILLSSELNMQPIDSFDVLERQCPERNVRSGPNLDILKTRYCAINSQEELRALAAEMAGRLPLGKLTFIDSESE